MHWMTRPLRRYADFRGRSPRVELWLFVLLLVIGFVVTVWLDVTLGTGGQSISVTGSGPGYAVAGTSARGGWITALFGLAMIVPLLAVLVRRLHDIGRSGLWLLIALVPLIGAIALLVMMLTGGQPRDNRFGPDPLRAGAQ